MQRGAQTILRMKEQGALISPISSLALKGSSEALFYSNPAHLASAPYRLSRKNKPNVPLGHTPIGKSSCRDMADDLNDFIRCIGGLHHSVPGFFVLANSN
jgi:hypothetical protein